MTLEMKQSKHIAIDLDGTLAEYHGWKGIEHIGVPITTMVERIRALVDEGHKWSIFTARMSDPNEAHEVEEYILNWVRANNLPEPEEVTAVKRKWFTEIWDDRAKGVIPNTGEFEVPSVPLATIPKHATIDFTEKALEVASVMSLPCFNDQVGGSHYKDMMIEPAVYCHVNKLDGLESNVIKYTSRHKFKNGAQDIDKAIDCLVKVKQLNYGAE